MGHIELKIDFEAYKQDKYGDDIDPDILADYKREEDFVEYHREDRILETIRIYMPLAPDWRLIDGFGKPAREQKFTPPKIPQRITDLQEIVEDAKIKKGIDVEKEPVTLSELFDYLLENQQRFKREIAFIKKMWYFRIYGYWCFINGQPTYIPGSHFFYCCFNNIDVGLPDYRDRDRRFYIFLEYMRETTEAVFTRKLSYFYDGEYKENYFNVDQELEQFQKLLWKRAEADNVKVLNFQVEYGRYVIDMGGLVNIGVNYPKHRREGATNKVHSDILERTTRAKNKHSGIISMTGGHAQDAFQLHLMEAWSKLIWFFKPEHEGSEESKTKLSLKPTSRKIGAKGAMAAIKDGLRSRVDFASTAKARYYDSRKLLILHDDETGKCEEEDVYARHNRTRPCLEQGKGGKIVGFTIKTSTVGEMTRAGGYNFWRLCEHSKNEERNQAGRTETGLVNLFIPSYDGLEGFVGPYGESVIDEPTDVQKEYIKKDYGARRHLDIEEQQIRLRIGVDDEAMEDLNEHFRLFPNQYKDCFRSSTSNVGFNVAILEDRCNDLQFEKDATETGDMEFDPDTRSVHWKQDPEGPMRLSYKLGRGESNLISLDDEGFWQPNGKQRFICSTDPTKFAQSESGKKSKFGMTVFMNRDWNLDGMDTMPDEMQSNRFVLDYIDDPPTMEEAFKKTLYACIYFGCQVSPENNYDEMERWFIHNGWHNFLYYEIDPSTGKRRKKAGISMQTVSKNSLFNAWADHIQKHGRRERHLRILSQARDIPSMQDMRKFDLFAAAGVALLTARDINPPEIRDIPLSSENKNPRNTGGDEGEIGGFFDYDVEQFMNL